MGCVCWKNVGKANKIVVITEIHDEEKKEEHLNFRRQCVENYDENIRGWIKHFTRKKCFRSLQKRWGRSVELSNRGMNCIGIINMYLIVI